MSILNRPQYLIRAALIVLLGLLIAFGLVFVYRSPPTDDSFYPKCTLHSATGLHCPGCGMTRAAFSALHGDFEQAVAYNVFAPLILPILAWAILKSARSLVTAPATIHDDDRPVSRWKTLWFPILIGCAILVFGVLRNLPWEPFTLLAPHELKTNSTSAGP